MKFRHEAKVYSTNIKEAHLLPRLVQTAMKDVGRSGITRLCFSSGMFMGLKIDRLRNVGVRGTVGSV